MKSKYLALALSALSAAFIGGGGVLFLYVIALQHNWLPLSDFTLPEPVALQDGPNLALAHDDPDVAESLMGAEVQAMVAKQSSGVQDSSDVLIPILGVPVPSVLASVVGGRPSRPAAARPQGPAVVESPLPVPGSAMQLSIPAIALKTDVVAGGAAMGEDGELEWQTLPFVAVHYAEHTGLVGSKGNPVLAGHVVTLSQGNVFRDLYRLLPGDRLFVQTDNGGTFVYQVNQIRLVDPNDVSVMETSSDPGITLITCAGTFDARTRAFSKRLIVVGSLVGTTAV